MTLNGTGSYDPDGDDLQYEWRVVDRGDFASDDLSLINSESATPKLAFLTLPEDERRNVTVELTVTDTAGATDTDRVNVTVYPRADDDRWWNDWWDDRDDDWWDDGWDDDDDDWWDWWDDGWDGDGDDWWDGRWGGR